MAMKKTYRLLGIISEGTGTWAGNSIIPLYMWCIQIIFITGNFHISKKDKIDVGKISTVIRDMEQLLYWGRLSKPGFTTLEKIINYKKEGK